MESIRAINLTKEFKVNPAGGLGLGGVFGRDCKMIKAVDDVSFSVERGEIFGLLGPNGAGKTTMLKLLSTLLYPTSGTAVVNGFDIKKNNSQVRGNIGLVLGSNMIYHRMTGRDNLEFYGEMYDIENLDGRIEELAGFFEMTDKLDSLVETYSTGMKCKLSLMRGMIHDPPILLLDEPTLGLDPDVALKLRDKIKSLKKQGKTIVLCTHYMLEAEQMCDRVGILNRGSLVTIGSPREIRERIPQKSLLEIEVEAESVKVFEKIFKVPVEDFRVLIPVSDSDDLTDKVGRIVGSGVKMKSINLKTPSLEDAFIYFTEN